jgi:N-methylhydantoinase A
MVEARYPHQVWEIDVAIDPDDILSGNVQGLEQNFHRTHEQIFAFADRGSAVEVIAWRVAVRCRVSSRNELSLTPLNVGPVPARTRRAFFPRDGWLEVQVLRFEELAFDCKMHGPAIVESPFTSIVIDPDAAFTRSARGDLILALDTAKNATKMDRNLGRA